MNLEKRYQSIPIAAGLVKFEQQVEHKRVDGTEMNFEVIDDCKITRLAKNNATAG